MTTTYDDHQTDVVCRRCWGVPCRCSLLTRALKRLALRLRAWAEARDRRAQERLRRRR